jgi:hypothetical protein
MNIRRTHLLACAVAILVGGLIVAFAWDFAANHFAFSQGRKEAQVDVQSGKMQFRLGGKPVANFAEVAKEFRARHDAELFWSHGCVPTQREESYDRGYNEVMERALQKQDPQFHWPSSFHWVCKQLKEANPQSQTQTPTPESQASRSYIECTATLIGFEKEHPWFSYSDETWSDGICEMAVLSLLSPASEHLRVLNVQYTDDWDAETATPPKQTDIGSKFRFQITADAIESEHAALTMENRFVRHVVKMQPE